jgi:flagellar protein FlgJ
MLTIGASTAPKPSVGTEAQKLAGMLWYEMLSAMNANGFDTSALGAGGSEFQSMFLWNEAETNFSKYDTGLVAAAQRQIGGVGGNATQAPAPATPAPAAPASVAQMLAQNAAASDITASALPAPQTGSLITQATSFAQALWPDITQAAATLGVPPVAVLAQAALETGWGVAAPGNNLFGIKAVDNETGTARATHEMVDGVLIPQTARFRDYSSPAASLGDYVDLIQNGYTNALGQGTVAGFAQALQAGGYATDTSYAAKIEQIAQSPLMAQVLKAVGGAAQPTNKAGGS